jgi:hypothetical protein
VRLTPDWVCALLRLRCAAYSGLTVRLAPVFAKAFAESSLPSKLANKSRLLKSTYKRHIAIIEPTMEMIGPIVIVLAYLCSCCDSGTIAIVFSLVYLRLCYKLFVYSSGEHIYFFLLHLWDEVILEYLSILQSHLPRKEKVASDISCYVLSYIFCYIFGS